jgi:hippurate hydrolase
MMILLESPERNMLEIKNLQEMVDVRRDIHAHPELAYEENRTAQVICRKLKEWGIPYEAGIGKTGVVATIRAGSADKAIALRADMDALPMQEENRFAHRSQHDGKMHGCGHDGHTTMLLTAAHYLNETRNFDGTVHLIFQPAEEGAAGAKAMLDDGLLERFPCEAIFGMHNWPGLPEGAFGYRSGPLMASSNVFKITVSGKGGHAAAPADCADPVPAIAQIAVALQTIVSRSVRPIDPAVLSITQIHTGSANNVIPDSGWLAGAVRCFSDDVIDVMEKRMRELATQIASSFGCTCEVEFDRRYPPLVNTPDETEFCRQVMESLYGERSADMVRENVQVMPSEDFSFFLRERPGSYVFLGNGEGSHREPDHGLGPCMLHNPSYDFNDNLIPIGASYWIRLTEMYLAAKAS